MSEINSSPENSLISEWQRKIEMANCYNIFCHCLQCQHEWIDSSEDVVCCRCGSPDVEHISCWQFPDD